MRPLQLVHGKISHQLGIGAPGTLNEPKPAEAEREVLGRYGFPPRPPWFRPLTDVELLVKMFGCDRKYPRWARFGQPICAYRSAEEPASVTTDPDRPGP